jgi:hypothetical protein
VSRVEFGQDLPVSPVKMAVAGWHPLCLHVRFLSVGNLNSEDFAPGLVYGMLPLDEAQSRLLDCVTCAPSIEEIALFGEPS